MSTPLPTPHQLRERFEYNPITGVITYKDTGREAGTIHVKGFRNLSWGRRKLKAHRVAWAIYHGAWPKGILDHINRNPADNRRSNLRPATVAQNAFNQKVNKTNRLGVKGVSKIERADGSTYYKAQIMKHGVNYRLGHFDTVEEAASAYADAARRLHGDFYCGG